MRPRPVCNLCHVHLNNAPRDDETELSYFQCWHEHDYLSERTYISKSQQNRKEE